MSQDSMTIANQSGASFRAALNVQTAALVSNNSGASAPSPTFAYMWWPDTSTGLLKQRNAANSGWITHGPLADLGIQTGAQCVATTGGTNNAVTLAFTPAAAAFWAGPVWWKSGASASSSTTPTVKRDGLAAKTAVGPAGAALAVGAIPANTWICSQYDVVSDKEMVLNPPFTSLVRSEIVLQGGGTYGSSGGNVIKVYANVLVNTGSDMTLTQSATVGTSVLINTAGYYAMAMDATGASNTIAGISQNSSQLTTSCFSITAADRVGVNAGPGGNVASVSKTRYLAAGTVIRPHTDGQSPQTSAVEQFSIVRVS